MPLLGSPLKVNSGHLGLRVQWGWAWGSGGAFNGSLLLTKVGCPSVGPSLNGKAQLLARLTPKTPAGYLGKSNSFLGWHLSKGIGRC